jgi:hypothetical protein
MPGFQENEARQGAARGEARLLLSPRRNMHILARGGFYFIRSPPKYKSRPLFFADMAKSESRELSLHTPGGFPRPAAAKKRERRLSTKKKLGDGYSLLTSRSIASTEKGPFPQLTRSWLFQQTPGSDSLAAWFQLQTLKTNEDVVKGAKRP